MPQIKEIKARRTSAAPDAKPEPTEVTSGPEAHEPKKKDDFNEEADGDATVAAPAPASAPPVSTLVPDLEKLTDFREVPVRFQADLGVAAAGLMGAKHLAPHEKAERLFEFFAPYAKRFVELATSGEELPTDPGPAGAQARTSGALVEVVTASGQGPGLLLTSADPKAISPEHRRQAAAFAAVVDRLDFSNLIGAKEADVKALTSRMLTAPSVPELQRLLDEFKAERGELPEASQPAGLSLRRRKALPRRMAGAASFDPRSEAERREVSVSRGRPLPRETTSGRGKPLPRRSQFAVDDPTSILSDPGEVAYDPLKAGQLPPLPLDLPPPELGPDTAAGVAGGRRRWARAAVWGLLQKLRGAPPEVETPQQKHAWERVTAGAVLFLLLLSFLVVVLATL